MSSHFSNISVRDKQEWLSSFYTQHDPAKLSHVKNIAQQLDLGQIQHILKNQYGDMGTSNNLTIHQTAPDDKQRWPLIWKHCQKSWKDLSEKHGMQYKFWSDQDLDDFVKTNYPEFFSCCYSKYQKRIQKVDSARYMILHHYGGIYADMDFEICDENLLKDVHKLKPSIVESPYKQNEDYHNSLMIAPHPRDPFWMHTLDAMKDPVRLHSKSVLFSTGPQMLDGAIYACKEIEGKPCVHKLPSEKFQPPGLNFKQVDLCQRHAKQGVKTIHHLTNFW